MVLDGQDPGELVSPKGYSYSAKPEHYQPRCATCHGRYDGHVGEGNGNAKLTDAQRRAIELSVGVTQQELADRHGIDQTTVSDIRTGRKRSRRHEL